MLSLESQFHSKVIAEALQTKPELNLPVAGRNRLSSRSERLWILSPLVRSAIGSLAGLLTTRDPLIILPDFSHEDIDTALKIVEGNGVEDNLILNSVTKDILETLGIYLKVSAPITMKTPYVRLKKVKVDNIIDSSDDGDDDDDSDYEEEVADEDNTDSEDDDYSISDDDDDEPEDIQNLLIADNPDVDDSDEEDDHEVEKRAKRNITVKRTHKVCSLTENTDNDSESSHDSDDNESSDDVDDIDDKESKGCDDSCDSDDDNNDEQSSDDDEVDHQILSQDLSSKLYSVDPLKKIKETIQKIQETIGKHDFTSSNKCREKTE